MADISNIEWTDSTFNPWEGCQKVGPGCDNCYAENRNARFGGGVAVNWGPGAPRRRTSESNWHKPVAWNAGHAEFFAKHGRRRRVFCASLADVFDNAVDPQWRADLFDLIAATPHLDWLLLTKRIGNVGNMLPVPFDFDKHYPNVWLGATIVNQEEADRDIPKLVAVPAAKRFLSMEPLLGPVELRLVTKTWAPGRCNHCCNGDRCDDPSHYDRAYCPHCHGTGGQPIKWVIVGGESGPGARPMHPDWARSLRDQCEAAGVAMLYKQWGEWANSEAAGLDLNACYETSKTGGWVEPDGSVSLGETAAPASPQASHVFKVGKKAAGRLLDGRTHDGYPA